MTTLAEMFPPNSERFPELLDVPKYARAVEQLRELRAKRTKLADVINRSEHAVGQLLNAAAEKLLAGEPPPDKGDLRTDLDQAKYELRIHDQAIRLQEQNVVNAEKQAQREIAVALTPRHKIVGRRMLAAFVELEAATREELAFRDQLERRGIISLPPIAFTVYNHGPRDLLDNIERWRREQSDYLR